MRKALITVFNDVNSEFSRSLQSGIDSLEGIESLKYKPAVHNIEIGADIVKQLEDANLIPTLCFIDPWGYKGLSLRLINSVLKDWACECIFFNYNRINMGLNNGFVQQHMDALFGSERAAFLRKRIDALPPEEREVTIVEELSKALLEMGGKYVLPFRFRNSDGSRTSHHLIFVSKHPLGYKIMKGIMARESSDKPEGVPSFEYNPATQRQPLLFELNRPLDQLKDMLCDEFSGKSLKMVDVFEQHHIGRRFVQENYKKVLAELEYEGRIIANPPASKRRKINGLVTFGDNVIVTFSRKKK